MRKKSLLLTLLAAMTVSSFGLVSCDLKGEQGPKGETGSQGIQGPAGSDGKDGSDGRDGSDGKDGSDGRDGSDGQPGKDGSDGQPGKDGSNGSDGLPGQDGKDGKDGTTIYTGISVPADKLGKDNDIYINTATWDVYKKTDGVWILIGNIKGEKGTDGSSGSDGQPGKDGSDGSDGQPGKDGSDGQPGKDGSDGDTPYVGSNGNWWVGQTDTGVKASGKDGTNGTNGTNGTDGKDGKDGTDGKSAYQIYKEKYEYEGTEEEWIHDLCNGDLADDEIYTVKFYNEGNLYQTKYVYKGYNVDKPENPTKSGYVLKGWFDENDDYWVFNGYTINRDINLYAKWEFAHSVVTFDATGGVVEYDTGNYMFGDIVTLPVPTRTGYQFAGWYYNGDRIEDGAWAYKDNMTLKARWTANTYTVTLNSGDYTLDGEQTTFTVTYGQAFTLPTATTADGTPFAGWSFAGKLLTNDDGTSATVWSFTNNITVDAEFFIPVKTASELQNISANLSGKYRLMNDIDLEEVHWDPIGSTENPFTGELNGGGHAINYLYINEITGDGTGLFSVSQNATFKDLTIYGSVISLSAAGASCIGTLSAYATDCLVNNVVLDSASVSYSYESNSSIGGVFGKFSGTVDGLSFKGMISSTSSGSGTCMGGLVGKASSINISNSSVKGSLVGNYGYAGGLIGRAYASTTIRTSSNGANLKFSSFTSETGGFIGQSDAETVISKSVNRGTIVGDHSGGFIGKNNDTTTTFERCLNEGKTDAGFIGYAPNTSSSDPKCYITITNCSNTYQSSYAFVELEYKYSSSGANYYDHFQRVNVAGSLFAGAFHKHETLSDYKENYDIYRYYGSSMVNSVSLASTEDKTMLTKDYYLEELGWSVQFWDFNDDSLGYVVPTLRGLPTE